MKYLFLFLFLSIGLLRAGVYAPPTSNASALTSGTVAYARLPVGTTSNHVAAADDARITGALSTSTAASTYAPLDGSVPFDSGIFSNVGWTIDGMGNISTQGSIFITSVDGDITNFSPDGSGLTSGGQISWDVSGNFTAVSFIGNGSALTGLPNPIYAGAFSATGTATTSFVVTIGHTMVNTNYTATPTARNTLSSALFNVSAKTTTTFTVTYLTGLTGAVAFDWTVTPFN